MLNGWVSRILTAVLIIVGLLLVNVPTAATVVRNMSLNQEALVNISEHPANPEVFSQAQNYNKHLTSMPVLDPWLNKIRGTNNNRFTEYLNTFNLDGHGLMGRLVIPAIGVSLPIYHDSNDDVLAQGVGHLFGSHLPIGGANTTSILTAHSGLPNATMFDRLPDLKRGDVVHIDYGNGVVHSWKMSSSRVILPDDVKGLNQKAGVDRLLLITCTPYGVNTHRLVVEADRVPDSEAAVVRGNSLRPAVWELLPWWVFMIAAADLIAAIVIVAWLVRRAQRVHKECANN
ncbi:MAG: class C sortase [Arcanobacterium sp.]|nr:class C sortase [Arcanobacterium sp.]MDY5588578.1 class C sortase [Arcanobacterium sp.]